MKRTGKKILTGLLSLCMICMALLSFAPLEAAAELEIGKVLATAVPAPVALMDVSSIAAATSTEGCYIAGYNWYDASGNVHSGAFGTGTYQVSIRIGTNDGYYFSDNVQVFLNNSQAAYTLDSDKRTLTLYREYTPDVWAPSVIKSPGSETVEEDGWASFVATATYVKSYGWTLTSPDGKTVYDCADLPAKFPGVEVSETNSEKIVLYHIPAELDGWKIRCVFHGAAAGADSYSNYATISVKQDETKAASAPAPTPEETKAPESPEPTSAPEEMATPSPAPASGGTEKTNHTHSFSETWKSDESMHWKSCTCGAKSEEAAHDMRWTTVMQATRKMRGTERGVCSVCGYVATRSVEYEAASDSQINTLRWVLYALAALVVLIVALMIVDSIRTGRRRRRRHRRRR